MSATRLAVVGAGGIADAYADVVVASDEVVIVAVADVRPAAAAALAQRLGAVAVARAEDALEHHPDAVVLCTPPDSHPALAQPFFDRGVAVLSEKPLAVDGRAAATMATAAADAGVLLGMAAKFRYCADVVAARSLLMEGRLGRLRLVENSFTSRVDMRNRWNADPSVSGGGVIIDNGTHSVDLVRFLAGPVTEVLAVEACRQEGLAVEDTAMLHLRVDDGVDATIELSWSVDKSLPDFLRLHGTEGEARVGWHASGWRHHGEDWRSLGDGYAKVPAMRAALLQFCRSVRGHEALEVTAADAVADAQVIDACYESLRHGSWVKVTDPAP